MNFQKEMEITNNVLYHPSTILPMFCSTSSTSIEKILKLKKLIEAIDDELMLLKSIVIQNNHNSSNGLLGLTLKL